MSNRRNLLSGFAACVAAAFLATAMAEPSGPAPDFTLVDGTFTVTGQVTLSGSLGDGLVLSTNPGLDLGVNVEENSGDGKAWLRDRPVSFPVLYDPQNGVSKQYDVVAMPSTVLIGRKGNVRYLHHGYQPGYENDYQDQVRSLVRERS